MKTVFVALSLLSAALTVSAAAPIQNRSQKAVSVMADMAPYVYPRNAAPVPERPQYAPDGTYLRLSDDGRTITRHNASTGEQTEAVLDIATTRENKLQSPIELFEISPDGGKILVATGCESIYRRSFKASWWVYEIRTRLLRPLSDTQRLQRAPLFSPDGRIVAFVGEDNNIYLRKTDYNTEVAVTKDGRIDSVINGVPDWVYEEEFATDCYMAWAPDSRTLCFLKYNESKVPAYSFQLYEGTCNPIDRYALYPGLFTYKYPVAGEPNSIVTLHSYDVDNRKIFDVPLNVNGMEYIPRIAFGGDSPDRLMVVTLDRDQRSMELLSVNPRSGVGRSVLSEQSEAWLPTDTYEQLSFGKDGFTVLSARTGWQHAYRYSYTGQLLGALTSGDFDVTEYYGSDLKGNHYVQTTSTGPINRAVCRIDPKGVMKVISPESGWSSAWFNPSFTAYCLTHSTSATPPVSTLYSAPSDKRIRVLDDGKELAARYASAPQREFITVPAADGEPMNAYVIKPAGFNSSQRYPVILTQYSGPGSQEVADRWRTDWTQYAATQGYMILCVDPHGTASKGRAWETSVYKDLGRLETLDLRAAARWAAAQPYVDGNRIGITGWSYGGYSTLMAVCAPDATDCPFAAAVAIAPVTDWRFYDTIYAERYMLTPAQNPDGYRTSAPLTYAADLNVPLLIIHGTADDNVHLANTMQFVSVMQSGGKLCDMMLYPNMNHSIYGCDARLSVYSKMLSYFDSVLK